MGRTMGSLNKKTLEAMAARAETVAGAKLDATGFKTGKDFNPDVFAETYEDSGKRYLPFDVQLAWFRMVYPEGKIIAEEPKMSPDKAIGTWVCSAKIYKDANIEEASFLAGSSARRGPDTRISDGAVDISIDPYADVQRAAVSSALRLAGFWVSLELPHPKKTNEKEDLFSEKSVKEESVSDNPVVKEELVAENPAVKEESVEENPAVKEESVEENPAVNEEPVEENPAVKEEPVAENPAVKEEPVEENPTVKEELVAENPAVNEEPVEENPAVKEEPVAENPAVKEEPVEENPTVKEELVAENPAVNEEPVEEKKPIRVLSEEEKEEVKALREVTFTNAYLTNVPISEIEQAWLESLEGEISEERRAYDNLWVWLGTHNMAMRPRYEKARNAVLRLMELLYPDKNW